MSEKKLWRVTLEFEAFVAARSAHEARTLLRGNLYLFDVDCYASAEPARRNDRVDEEWLHDWPLCADADDMRTVPEWLEECPE